MGLPRAPEARPFYQAARQRFEDARFLLQHGRTTGAAYLAGYCVECMLKALFLSIVPGDRRAEVLESFRGAKAHDFEWLRRQYYRNGGPNPPREVSRQFLLLDSWTTRLRYQATSMKAEDATAFLRSVEMILSWADGRL